MEMKADDICFRQENESQLFHCNGESHGRHRWNKQLVLPSSESRKQLLVYLAQVRSDAFQELQDAFNLNGYLMCLKACMSGLQLINSCRSGDVERIRCSDYSQMCRMDNEESSATIDAILQDVTENSFILSMRKKLGQMVKLVVPEGIKVCLDLLNEQREDAGINRENDYLFGLPENDGREELHLEAFSTLREFVAASEVPNPELLTATRLRKQSRTPDVKLHLTDDVLADLARFMEHQPDVHPSVYRLGDVTESDDFMDSRFSFYYSIKSELESNNRTADSEGTPSEIDDLCYSCDFPISENTPETTEHPSS